jgi:tetratricopeptide (TPR) repeat protein
MNRRRFFPIFTLSFPLILFLTLEILLRLFDYGPDLSLFRTEQIAGRTYHVMNPQVKSRYFSRVQFNPMTSLDFFLVPKPAHMFRIVCLGASTTAGYPYGYIGSFGKFLEDRLTRLLPDRSIEVINLGLTATNSFTTLDILNEVIEIEPDLIIVYDGHNEFYGALGQASHESLTGPPWIVRLYLQLVHSRVFLLMRSGYDGLASILSGSDDPSKTGSMMERLARGQTVPYGSSLYESVLSAFLSNFEKVIQICREHKVPLVLSSQVSNLRDQPPFISSTSEHLSKDTHGIFEVKFRQGRQQLANGSPDSALASLTHALALDSMRADLRYAIASCYDKLGLRSKALREYSIARDYDQLRFRMSSDFNRRLAQVAQHYEVPFADIEAAFNIASSDSIVGRNLILEHLHPTSYGYFLMAREYASIMRSMGLPATEADWERSDTLDEERLWNERSMTELDERAAKRRTEILVSSWPFTVVDKLVPAPQDRLGIIIDEMLQGTKAWEQAHVAAAEYFEATGDLLSAEREYRTLISMIPVNVSPYLRLGRLQLKQLKYQPARETFLQSMGVEPSAYACRALGSISIDKGKPDEAIPYLQRAVDLSQTSREKAESGYMLALAFGRSKRPEQAIEELRRVLRADPGFQPAKDLLQRLGAAQ